MPNGNEIKKEAIAKAFRLYSGGDVKQHWVKEYEELPNGKTRVTVEVPAGQAFLYQLGNIRCLEQLRDTKEIFDIIDDIGKPKGE